MSVLHGSPDSCLAVQSPSGLQKWSLIGGVWTLQYTLEGTRIWNGIAAGTAGSNFGTSSYAADYGLNATGVDVSGTVTTDGIRNLTGVVNGDGTVTIYGVTSTFDNVLNMDNGADPNEVLRITDTLSFASAAQAAGEDFSVFGGNGPTNGTVFRGVSLAPVPEPASMAVLASGLGLMGLLRQRRAVG